MSHALSTRRVGRCVVDFADGAIGTEDGAECKKLTMCSAEREPCAVCGVGFAGVADEKEIAVDVGEGVAFWKCFEKVVGADKESAFDMLTDDAGENERRALMLWGFWLSLHLGEEAVLCGFFFEARGCVIVLEGDAEKEGDKCGECCFHARGSVFFL
jgi:hypothetical protein